MPAGRPTDYSIEYADEICRRLIKTRSLLKVCAEEGMPWYSTVMIWLSKYPEFNERYTRAREEAYEQYADDIIRYCHELMDGPSRKEVCNRIMEMFESGSIPKREVIDDLLKQVVTHERVGAARLTIDTLKWTLSKIVSKKYGEKVEVEHKGDVKIEGITRKIVDPLTIDQKLTEKVLRVTKKSEDIDNVEPKE